MNIAYRKILLLTALTVLIVTATTGCSAHRKTNVYNTTEYIDMDDSNLEDTSTDQSEEGGYENKMEAEAAMKEEELDDKPKLNFSIETWIESMKKRGYEEKRSQMDGITQLSFERGACIIQIGITGSLDEKCRHFNLFIEKKDFDSAVVDGEVKDVYLDFISCLVELQGDEYDEDNIWNFITTSEELNGESYVLSDGIEAYSQLYMGRIEIVISPRR